MTQKLCQACGSSDLGDRFCERCDQFLAMPPGVKKASFPRRIGAYIVDGVLVGVPVVVIGLTLFIWWWSSALSGETTEFTELGVWRNVLLLFGGLFGGYLIWFLMTLQWGQTPGKQLFKIAAGHQDGRRLGWGRTFVREALGKGVVMLVVAAFTSGIGFLALFLVDLLWAFLDWDRQALHDKIVGSVVVDIRRLPAK